MTYENYKKPKKYRYFLITFNQHSRPLGGDNANSDLRIKTKKINTSNLLPVTLQTFQLHCSLVLAKQQHDNELSDTRDNFNNVCIVS